VDDGRIIFYPTRRLPAAIGRGAFRIERRDVKIGPVGATCLALLSAVVVMSFAGNGQSSTVFVCRMGSDVLFASNEDGAADVALAWTVPPTGGWHGGLFLGFSDSYAQGGVNDVGLCFGTTSVPTPPTTGQTGALPTSHPYDFCQAALLECASVDELEPWLYTHILARIDGTQFLFSDATGATLVVGVDPMGGVFIDRKYTPFRVITNYSILAPWLGGYPCWRFQRATTDLQAIASGAVAHSLGSVVDILQAVDSPNGPSEFAYSNVFDPVNGLVYLYSWHDFDRPAVMNVRDVTATAWSSTIPALFP